MSLFHPKNLQLLHTCPLLFQQVAHLRGDALWGFNADGGVPLSRWQNSHLVKELIYPSQQVTPVFRFVSHVMEDLVRGRRRFNGVPAQGILQPDSFCSYFISHDSCHRASDFVILLCLSIRAQENKQEPNVFQLVVRSISRSLN